MTNRISWDDWRIVHAIIKAGTTSGAAGLVGLNQSTVFRRISQLEDTLGVRLFERDKSGFRLTTEGESVLDDIRKLQDITSGIERRIIGYDDRPAGEVVLSVNSTVLRLLLSDILMKFRNDYPDIVLKLDLNDRLVNLKQREADLVIRGSNDPDPNLYGRRIMRLSYAIYAGRDWVNANRQSIANPVNPEELDWIGWDGSLTGTAPGQWLRKLLGDKQVRISASDVESTAYLAANGHGCALLPRFLGDQHTGIEPISDTIPGLYTELWVLTHEDLRKTARVSALLRYIAEALKG